MVEDGVKVTGSGTTFIGNDSDQIVAAEYAFAFPFCLCAEIAHAGAVPGHD